MPPPTALPTPSPIPTGSPGVRRPDPRLTPGEVFPQATVAVICVSGYTATVRHVTTAQKKTVYAEYGVPYPEAAGTYEFDHLIPLELGGDNANANLWPEPASPAPGYHQKDEVENTLHALVCARRLDLHEAQHAIASDWYGAYQKYVGTG
ncbi:MAG: HNH endonuclease [Candidatus Dormibacteria bacterium]